MQLTATTTLLKAGFAAAAVPPGVIGNEETDGVFHVAWCDRTQDYMLGDAFTIADITVAIQANRLVQNSGFGFDALAPSNFPNIVAWHGRLSTRPAFAQHVLPRFE